MRYLPLAALLFAAACAPGEKFPGGAAQLPVSPRFQALAQTTAPGILVSVESQNRTAVVLREARNGDVTRWLGPDGTAISFRGGLLVATRGLGDDLMIADVAQSLAALRAGTGRAQRVHEYLDGNNRIRRLTLDCTISTRGHRMIRIGDEKRPTTLFEERCVGLNTRFTNLYWRDAAGTVVQSRQWVGHGLGALALRILVR